MRTFLVTIAVYCAVLQVAGQQFFAKKIGDPAYDEVGLRVFPLPDDQLLLVGVGGDNSDGFDIVVYRTDISGNTIWQKKLGTEEDYDVPYDAMLYDGHLYIAAVKNAGGVVYKVNYSGEMVQEIAFPQITRTHGFSSVAFYNNAMYVAARVNGQPGDVGINVLIIKADMAGNYIWEREFNQTFNSYPMTIVASDTSLIVSNDYLKPNGNYGVNLISLSEDGDTHWMTNVPTQLNMGCQNVIIDDYKNIVVVGECSQNAAAQFDPFLAVYTLNGTLKWWDYLKGSEESDAGFSVIQNTAESYLITGYAYNDTNSSKDFLFSYVDTAGTFIGQYSYGFPVDVEIAYHIVASPVDDAFIILGESIAGGDKQMFLVHDRYPSAIEPAGIASLQKEALELSGHTIRLRSGSPMEQLTLMSLKGDVVFTQTTRSESISIPAVIAGVYVAEVRTEKGEILIRKITL